MFASSGSPSAGPAGLRLARIERLGFDKPASDLDRPEHLAGYLADLLRPYPVELVSAVPDGQSYAEMAAALIQATVPADQPVDLLLLCFAVPDLHPGRATATYLSHLCPGTPLSFAVCEQGSAAAFTGLRIVSEFLASADCRRALLIVVEQAGLPYPVPVPVPAEHRGVALLLESSPDGPQLGLRHQAGGVPADQVAKTLTELIADRPSARLLLSEALAAHWSADDRTVVAPAGQPSTGLWWQLFDGLAASTELLLADYEPQLGYLSVAGISRA